MVTKLFILLVVVLGVIALAQIMRVYELSSKLTDKKENEISNRDNRLNARLMLGFMAFLFIGFIWLMLKYGWTGRGDAASIHGKETDWLLNVNFVIVILVFFFTNALLFWFSFKYVKKPGVPAFFYPHNNKLEMVWTVIPAVVLAVIIILGLRSWNDATSAADPEAIRVELFSKQFDWTARYAGPDNVLGRYDYKLTDESKNPLALMTSETIDSAIFNMEDGTSGINALEAKLNDPNIIMSAESREAMLTDLSRKERLIRLLHQMKQRHEKKFDSAAMDDILEDTLFLRKNQQYEFTFRSKDVIHSAFFPHFRAQMNTVPGSITRFKFTPDISTAEMREMKKDEKFNYVLMCNKICGGSHYKMKMTVVVLEEKEYDEWMNGKYELIDGKKRLTKAGKVHNSTFANTYYGLPAAITYAEEMAAEAEKNKSEDTPEGDDENPEGMIAPEEPEMEEADV